MVYGSYHLTGLGNKKPAFLRAVVYTTKYTLIISLLAFFCNPYSLSSPPSRLARAIRGELYRLRYKRASALLKRAIDELSDRSKEERTRSKLFPAPLSYQPHRVSFSLVSGRRSSGFFVGFYWIGYKKGTGAYCKPSSQARDCSLLC